MILLHKLHKSFGHQTLLKEASFHCPQNARVALVGNNGTGKTTLLNILCGFDKEFEGDIIKPKELRLGYLPQIVNQDPKPTLLEETLTGAKRLNTIMAERHAILHDMAAGVFSEALYDRYDYVEGQFNALNGYRVEEDARDLLRGFGFKDTQFDQPVTQLSGGWRMRVELAKMLLDEPNFLILDEPTNHLDLPSIEWFQSYLKKFQGTILFVSHDKDLLNHLATHVLHLRSGKLTAYTGNFDAFLEAFTLKQTQNEQASKNLQQQYTHIEQFVNRFRAKPSKARQVQSRLKTLAKIQALEDSIEFENMDDTMMLALQNPKPSGKEVLKVDHLAIGYAQPLVKNLTFTVHRGQRIAILGANGLGKSTLLKSFLGKIPALSGTATFGHNVSIGYFAQEHLEGLKEGVSVFENIQRAAPAMPEMQARRLLAMLGLRGDAVFKPIRVLSGGEKNRTALACLLATQPNTLFLDEPTNHLDLSACEILANALADFSGTVFFVSHNKAFIETVATHILYLKEKGPMRLEEVCDFQER